MYSTLNIYCPFFPSFVASLRAEINGDVIVKSSHAYEIVSAFLGYKSYAAAKVFKIDQQIGIFHVAAGLSNLPDRFYASPDFKLASSRIHRLMPDLTDAYSEILLKRLDSCYEYESGWISGYISRMSRQLSRNYEHNQDNISGSVYLIQEDLKISGDIASFDEYESFTFSHLPLPEIQVIAMSKPLTVGDKLHQVNAKVIANIVNFIAPNVINEIRGVEHRPMPAENKNRLLQRWQSQRTL
jgi:hypothetical protein